MKTAWLIVPALFLSSCFETVEEISLKADGSGTFNYIINLSQSRSEISAALKLDSFMGTRIPSLADIKSSVAEARDRLKASPGISEVVLTEDYANFIIQIRGQFSSIDKLNAAAKNISIQMGADESVVMGSFNYTMTDSTFSRDVTVQLEDKWVRWAEKLLGNLATKATYTCIIRHEKTAAGISNPVAKISPSKKAVLLRANAKEVLADPKSLNLTVRYTQ